MNVYLNILSSASPALKPIKERLGLPAGSVASAQPGEKSEKCDFIVLSGNMLMMHFDENIVFPTAETNTESKKAPEEIRIKTLEEIRQEKLAKSQRRTNGPSVVAPECNVTKTITTETTKGVKRAITIKDDSISHVKTFSEILRAKKKRQEEEQKQKQNPSPKKTEEKAPGKSQGESDAAEPRPEAANVGGVKVKTLEEIRREKAARIQAQQALEAENRKTCDTEENSAKKPRLLCIKKLAAQSKTAFVLPFFWNVCRILLILHL